jgi:uncharacterized membrane protein
MFRELLLFAASQLCVFVIILTDVLLLSYFDMWWWYWIELKPGRMQYYAVKLNTRPLFPSQGPTEHLFPPKIM